MCVFVLHCRFSSAMGLTIFFRGMGVISGPLIAGILKDLTHMYEISFLVCGLIGIAASVLMLTATCRASSATARKWSARVLQRARLSKAPAPAPAPAPTESAEKQ